MDKKLAYKGFDVDNNNNLNCRGFIFKVGEEYSINGNLEMCKNGFHFCWELNNINEFYSLSNSVICQVEIIGDILNDTDMKKSCTNKIKISKLLTKEEVLKISNSGVDNSGFINSGDRNSGNWNSGDWNSGNWNSGNMNSGNMNSGDWNTGDGNTGNWNNTNYNNGFFNTIDIKVSIFNMLSNFSNMQFKDTKYYNALTECYPILTGWIYYTQDEKNNDKAKELIGGYLKKYDYKEAHKIWWGKLSNESKEIIKSIPNFNAKIFEEITGIIV